MGATVLYDHDCGLCRWLLAKLLAWDRRGRLRPVALQSEEARRLTGSMGEQRRMGSWHLVEPGGQLHSAGAAFGPLLRELPGGRALAALAERFPGATERGYRLVADNRNRLGPLIPASAKRRADARIRSREAAGA